VALPGDAERDREDHDRREANHPPRIAPGHEVRGDRNPERERVRRLDDRGEAGGDGAGDEVRARMAAIAGDQVIRHRVGEEDRGEIDVERA